MEPSAFWPGVVVVLTANLLTIWFLFSAYTAHRHDRAGQHPPLYAIGGMLFPLACAGFGIYLLLY